MPTGSVSDQELQRLFLGDKLSLGYYHPNLIFELCRRIEPDTFERLRSYIFGVDTPITEIDSDAYETLREGYDWWAEQGRPRVIANA